MVISVRRQGKIHQKVLKKENKKLPYECQKLKTKKRYEYLWTNQIIYGQINTHRHIALYEICTMYVCIVVWCGVAREKVFLLKSLKKNSTKV